MCCWPAGPLILDRRLSLWPRLWCRRRVVALLVGRASDPGPPTVIVAVVVVREEGSGDPGPLTVIVAVVVVREEGSGDPGPLTVIVARVAV